MKLIKQGYYAKQVDENGAVVALHAMPKPFAKDGVLIPITEEEYLELLAAMQPAETDKISDAEALAIITGGAAV